jgi:hypothetical protein
VDTRCLDCGQQVPTGAGQRFCGACGAPLPASGESVTSPGPDVRGRAFAVHSGGRFLPGAMVAGRYRMVGLLGRGGMGEVYRADDLKLGQPVALKFLPAGVARDPVRLTRFLNEVRLSLRVTHPNVCRVFDVGEIDQRHFLSMEYVDGEDLGSLLRRIGRLPEDKAVEIARQVCAGLAAAHDAGVLHRDIKPANIMIDGRGRAKITDFGLAGAVAGITGVEARAGTPQYMAPEQIDGGELSERTDVYALGLVLYELFTGRRAFEAHRLVDLQRLRSSAPPSPASIVTGLDPLTERAILRCLEVDPARRPPSATALAALLPGGDPLAMAIAAGDTPSPEMVAAAGAEVGIKRPLARLLLGISLVGAVAFALLAGRVGNFPVAAPRKPPDVLIERAQEILAGAGLRGPVRDSAWGVGLNTAYRNHVALGHAAPGDGTLAEHGAMFWYREAPVLLERGLFVSPYLLQTVSANDPRLTYSGESLVMFDRDGRLLSLTSLPPQLEEGSPATIEPDWTPFFKAAGLDYSRWIPAQPQWTNAAYADHRVAWIPPGGGAGAVVRVEAASYRGRPVSFEQVFPWTTPWRDTGTSRTSMQHATDLVAVLIFFSLMVTAVVIARRNLRLDRADRKGALRVGLAVMALLGLVWLVDEHHVPSVWEFYLFVMAAGWALFVGALIATFYLALEPHVRRTAPAALVSWSRLVAGRFADPLVARDVLIGCAIAILTGVMEVAGTLVSWRVTGALSPIDTTPRLFMGAQYIVSELALALVLAAFLGLMSLFLFFVMRRLLFRDWAAVLGSAAFFVLPTVFGGAFVMAPFVFLIQATKFLMLARIGLVAIIAEGFAGIILRDFPVTWPLTMWYSRVGLVGVVVTIAIAFAAFRIVMKAQSRVRGVTS